MSETPKSSSPQVPKRRGRAAQALGGRIMDQAAQMFQRAGFSDAGFVLHWREIAGEHIARVAQPVKWEETPAGAVLTLRCEPGAAVLLQHETRSLVEKCNAYLGQGRVARLKLVPGELPRESAPPAHPAPFAEPRPDKLDLSQALDRIRSLRAKARARPD
jgi:hypothetical protein